MIRVNLLEGTAEHRVAVQKTKVAARRGQQLFMVAAALIIFMVALAGDHLWTTNAHAEAQAQLDHEQEVAKKLEADVQRKNELEAELKQVEERIKVIKQLRAEQKGPVALMSAINERMPGGPADFRLDQITQKGTHLQIIGTSLNQQVIADFARQLEFSNGLFSNLVPTIESTEVKSDDVAERKQADKDADKAAEKKDGKDAKDAKKDGKKENDKVESETARIFRFTIDCDYNKPRAEDAKDAKTTPPPAPGK
jgi:Tfp pilus assembly protein PilN